VAVVLAPAALSTGLLLLELSPAFAEPETEVNQQRVASLGQDAQAHQFDVI
jgi:hypothetical protein